MHTWREVRNFAWHRSEKFEIPTSVQDSVKFQATEIYQYFHLKKWPCKLLVLPKLRNDSGFGSSFSIHVVKRCCEDSSHIFAEWLESTLNEWLESESLLQNLQTSYWQTQLVRTQLNELSWLQWCIINIGPIFLLRLCLLLLMVSC